MKFIIAQYKEDVSWAKDLDHYIITKEKDIPNVGRETTSFLYYIINNYYSLEGEYVFCQGHPFDHWRNFISEIKKYRYVGALFSCDPEGNPNEPGLNIHEVCLSLGLPISETYKFRAGMLSRLSSEQIHKRPIEWYTKALIISVLNQKSGWIFERIWPLIFDLDTTEELDPNLKS